MDEHPTTVPGEGPPGYEDDAVPSGLILRVVGGTIVVTLVLCITAYLLADLRESQLRPSHVFPERELGAPRTVAQVRSAMFEAEGPMPQAAPATDPLLGYRWVDRSGRKVAIPIERAMQIVAARHHGESEE
jgi:hypothetical protein